MSEQAVNAPKGKRPPDTPMASHADVQDPPQTAVASRKEILPAFLGVMIGAILLYALMVSVQPMLANNNYIYDFGTMMAGCMQGMLPFRAAWVFADLTEASFMASLPGTIGMIVMGFVAASLERRGSSHAGTGVSGNSDVFSTMFVVTVLSLILSQVVYGSFFQSGWIPTFATVLTVQVFVTFYESGFKQALTELVVGTLITFPVCYYLLYGIVLPLNLPLFVAVSVGVAIVVPICSLIFRAMPWMTIKAPAAPSSSTSQVPNKFFFHQVFGDIGQLTIWGSSWATIGMYVGGIVSWVMNPLHPAYGTGNFPLLILAQIVTAALAIFLWYPKWKQNGMAFTFAGVVFSSAIVITYTPSWMIAIPTIIIGAIAFAPYVEWVIKVFRFKGTYHPIALIQVAISSACILWSFIVMYLITPMIG
jgi:hypothetical protein